MKIFIPSHLRRLKILDDLCSMVTHYVDDGYYENAVDSFDDFYGFYLKTDPVKQFVEMTAKIGETVESEEEYEEMINYISTLFYSVKGTPMVFDFIRYYLNFKFDYSYDGRRLRMNIERVETTDENRFTKCLESFLSSLLFFNDSSDKLDLKIKYTNLRIEESIESNLTAGLLLYRDYTCLSNEN